MQLSKAALLLLLVFTSAHLLFLLQQWGHLLHILSSSCFLIFFICKFCLKPSPVYLVDFSCYKPPDSCRVPLSVYVEHVRQFDFMDEKSVSFISKVLSQSGQGEGTYLPPSLHSIPPESGHRDAISEVHMVLFPIFEELLTKSNLRPHEIDILIVNCSGFCPAPSLSSIIVGKYGLREDVKSFNLTGMGCSASAIAVDMAQKILQTSWNSNAVVLSTEILSTGWYSGKEPPMMVLNCLFRMGGAAVLLTNRAAVKRTAKYKLILAQRTQRAFDDKGYYSAFREEDENGITGVTLRKDLIHVAGEALRAHIAAVGGKMLPLSEKLRYGLSVLRRFVDKSREVYVPDFKSVVEHFCLPTSGKPVIGEIKKGLKLEEGDVEPALMTLHRFGNQSSSSLWYEVAYMEAMGRVKKGDRIWMLGMGTGPKSSSLILECVRPIVGEAQQGPWADSVDQYPIITVNGDSMKQ